MNTIEASHSIPKYLEIELDKIAKSHQFSDYTIEVNNGLENGDGFMAVMIMVTIKGHRNENGVTVNCELPLICKIIPQSAERREAFSSDSMFEREVYFYKTILPIFVKFLEERNINVDEDFSLFPKCFAAVYDSESDGKVIIMENLKSSGFDMWPKTVPIDFETAATVLTELGKFHAVSFAIYDQKKEIFDEMFRVSEPFFKMFRGNGAAEGMVGGSVQQVIDVLDDPVENEIMQRVKDNYEIWLKELLASDAAGRFGVLNHGDPWNNNMMFHSNQRHKQIRFLDFQILRLASPAVDISYYICTSTNADIHQRIDELLRIYYDSLAAFLTKMGSDPQKLFTFDDLKDQLRRFAKYGLTFAPILISVMVSDSKDIIDMDTIKNDTTVDGLVNLNEGTKILLKERVSSVIQLAIKSGWI